MKSNLHHVEDSTEFLKAIPDNTYTACLTDGPYGISFMGKSWDTFDPSYLNEAVEKNKSTLNGITIKRPACEAGRYNRSIEANIQFQNWTREWTKEALRVVKPGGYLLSFCGPRTYHRMVSGIEDAGWIIRDCMMWIYGSGFPKSHNIGNSVDKHLGCSNRGHAISSGNKHHPTTGKARPSGQQLEKYQARTSKGKAWEGYGTALKPAYEPILLAMKPLDGTYAENAMQWETAGLNIDAGRIENNDRKNYGISGDEGNPSVTCYGNRDRIAFHPNALGRWPANVVINDYAAGFLDALAEENVSRFFYCSKASRSERDAGLDKNFQKKMLRWSSGDKSPGTFQSKNTDRYAKNFHPTVKPLDLMRYLVRLVKMPAHNHILDPFMGSGSTGCACAMEGIETFTGLDKTAEYLPIAEARIKYWETVSVKGRDFEELQNESQGELFEEVGCE